MPWGCSTERRELEGEMSTSESTILVVDDDDDLRTMVGEILRPTGHVVIGAATGQEAYSMAVEKLPSLIIMDIGMPEMDGLSTLWKMRKHEGLATVPVIVLTAYDSYDLRGEAASAGCHEYLTKPFEPEELQELVNRGIDSLAVSTNGKRLEG